MHLRYLLFILVSFLMTQSNIHDGHDHHGHDLDGGGFVRGQLLSEETGIPIGYATVTLINKETKTEVAGTITDDIGTFKIENIPPGEYDIIIEFMGYEKMTIADQSIIPPDMKKDLGLLFLVRSAIDIDTVEVESEKAFVEEKMDRKVYNADSFPNTRGGNASDILEQIPSVTLDIDGNVNLRGNSDVTILIDGRKSSFGNNVDMIGAEMVERVEVITTPSAKFDPDGTAGIINLILRKNEYEGTSGNIVGNLGELFPEYNRWHNYGMSGRINVLKKDWNVFTSFKAQSNHRYGKNMRNTIYYEDDINDPLSTSSYQTSESDDYPKTGNIKMGIEHYPDPSTTVAFDITLIKHRGTEIEDVHIDYQDESMDDFTIEMWEKGEDLNYGFGYFLDIDEDQKLTIQLDYDDHDDLEYTNYDNTIEKIFDNGKDHILAIDYTHPIGASHGDKKSQIEVGLKYNLLEDIKNQEYNDNPFEFDYEDSRLSTYFNIGYYFSESFGMQFGSRFEMSETESTLDHMINTNDPQNTFEWALSFYDEDDFNYDYDYERVYPSLFFLYDMKQRGSFKLEFGRRINRPWEGALNPFPDVSEVTFIHQGNPYLKPEDIYKWELSYSGRLKFGYLSAAIFSSEITDQIDRYKYSMSFDDEIYPILTWINKGKVESKGFELQFMTRPLPMWDLMLWGTYWNNNTLEATEEDMLGEESGFYAHIMSKFNLNNDQEIQLSGGFSTPMKINTGEISAMKNIDVSYKKDISDRFNIMLTVKDLFDTREFHIITDRTVDGINEHLEANHRRNKRFFKIAFEYKFGAFKEKKYIREGGGHDHDHEGDGGMDAGY